MQNPEKRTVDIYAPNFAGLVDCYLEKLKWKRADFIAAVSHATIPGSAISAVQFSRWANGKRGVGRATAIRAALVLALEFEKRRDSSELVDPSLGLANLDWLLQEFLNAAGYPGNLSISLPTDTVWTRVQERKEIEVAYVPIPPWAVEGREIPSGASIEVARRVTMLLGCRIKWKRCSWGDLPALIREREVDMVAPILMASPERLREYRFSEPVSKRRFGLKLLASKPVFPRNIKPKFEALGNKLQVGYVTGEIGQIACSLIQVTEPAPVGHPNFESALAWLSETKTEVPRILASEESTCDRLAGDTLVAFHSPKEWAKVKFGICFGAHPDEREFINAINYCIPLLEGLLPPELQADNERR